MQTWNVNHSLYSPENFFAGKANKAGRKKREWSMEKLPGQELSTVNRQLSTVHCSLNISK
jgi:hypothetical protein